MITTIVTDIEGTTSSLSFVKDVLFPYARERMAEYLQQHHQEDDIKKLLDDVRAEVKRPEMTLEAIIQQLIEWIDQDQKITPLKTLQGYIWQAGFNNKDYYGHVYPDTVVNLKKWKDAGLALYIYSSGSVYAQKLLFSNTEQGDLTPLFDGYFDTHIGHKREAQSYSNIAKEIDTAPASILFLSDIEQELDAARQAGMHTCQLLREGVEHVSKTHPVVNTFDEIQLSDFAASPA